ncbi:MAG: 50S ribosomal protein L23 [Armatimonadetes bacterium]|nr:50S ribosomal protein L23 [Armatimonadota bacterium]
MKKNFRDIIKRPLITEKTMQYTAFNKYAFEVDSVANKIEIRKAIENIFKVKVLKVNTTWVKSKLRKVGRFQGKTTPWKKAIVTLKEGNKIELAGVNLFEQ